MAEIHSITVYLGATTPKNPIYVDAVRELGRLMAKRGLTLVFGGSKEGTMEILADEILHNGGKAVGIFTDSLPAEFLYPGLTETVVVHDLADRKNLMRERGDAIIALPGSFGTWDELFDALERSKIAMINGGSPKPIGVLNLNGFFDGLMSFIRRSVDEGFTAAEYASLLKSGQTVEELLQQLGV
jgi:uncharacterized protein (TIGR00730 family)